MTRILVGLAIVIVSALAAVVVVAIARITASAVRSGEEDDE